MRTSSQFLRRFALAVAPLLAVLAVIGAAVAFGTAIPAGASPHGWRSVGQSAGEGIQRFSVEAAVNDDGSIDVTETIVYDFASRQAHGIERYVTTSGVWTGEPPEGEEDGDYIRRTPISNIEVRSTTGAPDRFEVFDEEDYNTRIRVGDPNRTISGEQTYVVSYRLGGVINEFDEHDELYYNVTGNGWAVPMADVSLVVEFPGEPNRVACYAGRFESRLSCDSITIDGNTAVANQARLHSNEGLTVVVAVPKGVLGDPMGSAVFERKRTLGDAFATDAPHLVVTGLALVAGMGGVAMLGYRKGRDRHFLGDQIDYVFGEEGQDEAPRKLFSKQHHTVEFVPPGNIRPGHMGTLWDEEAHHLDVSAMIVDLAVRGYLRIDEIAPQSKGFLGFGGDSGDYQLVLLKPVHSPELLPAEQLMLESLFAGDKDAVLLSDLKTKFADRLKLIQSRLYDDVVEAGWFPTRPDRVREIYLGLGVFVLIAGGLLTWLAGWFSSWGLPALVVPLIGIVLIVSAKYFPHRTAKGSAMLSRVRGFKELFDAGESERMAYAEKHNVFAQYLPYAIVFGATERWAKTFQDLGLTPQQMGLGVWYTSPYAYDPIRFAWAMNSFTTHSTGSLAAAAPSAASSGSGGWSGGSGFSGGFSGGGFGGGGGGSW